MNPDLERLLLIEEIKVLKGELSQSRALGEIPGLGDDELSIHDLPTLRLVERRLRDIIRTLGGSRST